MTLKFKLDNKTVGQTLRRNMVDSQQRITQASRAALNDARERILVAGRNDMREGGNFGSARWQTSLQGDIKQEGSRLVLSITHRVFFWRVFEYGAIIRAKNASGKLWIPLRWNPTKVRARDFPGKLFRVNRKGGKNPLLMTNAGGNRATAMYVGVSQVRLRRRFHLRPIIRRVAKQMPFLFKKWTRLANKAGVQ